MNPFINVPRVSLSQEILDSSFRRASKVNPRIGRSALGKIHRMRVTEATRLDTASSIMCDQLKSIVKGFPSLDSIEPFYKEIADIVSGLDKMKEALGALDGYRQVIRDLSKDYNHRIRSATSVNEAIVLRRAAYGRLSSIIKKAGARLELLADARAKLRKIVSIDTNEPTVVVAGAPNVGKSSMVRMISSAKPEVADYPFTTRSLVIGHLSLGKRRIQVIDTPGLLDRPISERNRLELQAIVALRYLAKLIIFLFDPSEICGYTLGTQVNVYNELRDLFKEIPFIIAINKIDILKDEQLARAKELVSGNNILVETSAVTREGVDKLIDEIPKTLSLPQARRTTLKHEPKRGDSAK
nr:GTPase [Candidatus Njordarchaeota archaeon]